MHVYIKEFTYIQILLKKLTIHQGACFIVYVGVYDMALGTYVHMDQESYVYEIVHVLGASALPEKSGAHLQPNLKNNASLKNSPFAMIIFEVRTINLFYFLT
jgi:hypothetical protein